MSGDKKRWNVFGGLRARVLAAGLTLAAASTLAAAQALTSAPRPTPHPDTPAWVIEPAGAWGGPVNAFEKHGDTAYIGSGQRLVVLDLSDPTDVRELGAVRLGSAVIDLKARDGLVYVVTAKVSNSADAGIRASGFHVVDAANPVEPELIWSGASEFLGSGNSAGAIHGFYGDYAFLRDASGSRWVADLTDPHQPVVRSDGFWLRNPAGGFFGANDMVIRGDLAFVATTETIGHLRVFDLATIEPGVWPLEPQHLGSVSFFLNRFAYEVAVDGDWAYVAVQDPVDEQEEIWAVDVSDPSNPVKHGSFDGILGDNLISLHRRIGDLAIADGRLYAANGAPGPEAPSWDATLGLAIFDIATDPGQPALIATHRTHGSVRGVAVEGDTVFLRDWGEGLIVLDAADPTDPVRLGGYHSPAQPDIMERDGDLLFVSDPWNGLSILDVSDMSSPTLVGVYQTPERLGLGVSGLALLDGHIHLAAGHAGLEVIDVTAPANPVLRGAIRFPSESWWTEAVVADALPGGTKVAYLSVVVPPSAYVFSLDVTNPASPTQLDPSPPGINPITTFSRCITPGRFFVASWGSPAFLLDGSDPNNLQAGPIAGQSSNRVRSLDYDPDRGVLYLTDRDDDRAISMAMTSDSAGVELIALDLGQAGDVASHPRGLVAIGNGFPAGSGARVALVDMASPLAPRVLASARVGFRNASAGLIPISRVLASDDAIFVTNGGPVHPSQHAGLETFTLRRTADRNGDGGVNLFDLSTYLAEVRRGDPSADLNKDGRVDRLDIEAYLRLMGGAD